jgi:CSLREA domain-containing protein
MRRRLVVWVAVIAGALAGAGAARATTFTVNVATDSNDGSCATVCSLRDAITALDESASINALPSPDEINIEPSLTIILSGDLPAITQPVTIKGHGSTIDGNKQFRGLFVYGLGADGQTAALPPIRVSIDDLTITNAQAEGGTGGGGGAGLGGGLFVSDGASVVLTDVAFGDDGAVGGAGGNSDSSCTMSCTIGALGGGGMGGAGGDGGGGGGGVGSGASGGQGFTVGNGSPGIVLGAEGGGGNGDAGVGGANGGGGAGDVSTEGGSGGGVNGAGEGVNGGGGGGFGGGGGGGGEIAGDGGFGGGGGSVNVTATFGGSGGFGGGSGGSVGTPGFGGGSGDSNNDGGGGLGAGGAIFAQQGGSVTVEGALSESGGSVKRGASGGGTSSAGSGFGSGIFLEGSRGSLVFSPGAGQSQTVSDAIADQTGSGGKGSNAGSWAVSKTGAGTLVLSGKNSYSGGTSVRAGALDVRGTVGAVSVSGGTFEGDGSTGAVSVAGGTLAPGVGASTGVLRAAGLTLHPSARFAVRLSGGSPGSGYDQLSDSGPLQLGGASLSVHLGYLPAVGQMFTIVHLGTDLVLGRLAGLPEGAVLNVGAVPMRISYTGGGGRDVTLTVLAAPVVYAGYADGIRKGHVSAPSPWEGSPGVSFDGCNYFHPDRCPRTQTGTDRYDAGAIRIDNTTGQTLTVTKASVVIGSCTLDPWPALKVTLQAGKQLILTQTGGRPPCHLREGKLNFDTSDTGHSCTRNDHLIPVLHLNIDGAAESFSDRSQILNTGGVDPGAKACGHQNETHAWGKMTPPT